MAPRDLVRVTDIRQLVEVASDKNTIEGAPSLSDDAEITAEFEERVYAHFGATREPPPTDRGGYGAYHGEDANVDLEYGERSRVPEYGSTAPATPAGDEYPAGDREAAGSPNPTGEEGGYEEAEPREGARVCDWDIGTERRETGGSRSGADTTDSESTGTVGPGMSMGDTE